MKVLVTGGAGYIGSHTLVALYEAGHTAEVVDNLCNSSEEALLRVNKIVGARIPLHKFDLREKPKLSEIFKNGSFDAVIHFAGLKSVGESVEKPLLYYRNNLDSTLALCTVMQANDVKKLVFSSSATVYGQPKKLPITEKESIKPTNPYGRTKSMIEQILTDISRADSEWQVSLLRYFNPVGAHASGTIGEDPNGPPNNLVPYISQVAVGKRDKLKIFGNDYETPDGTGMRDYIHITDLADGHIKALEHLPNGVDAYNLGTGTSTSVLEIVKAFEKTSGKEISYEIVPRRSGDIDRVYADPSKAGKKLHWQAAKTIDDMCVDTWRWQSQNPNGYKSSN